MDNHVCCTHWEPLPGGREVCCTCNQEGDVDNPQAERLYEEVVRLRAARDAVVGLMNGYMSLGPCCERDDARDLINDAMACFDNYEEETP